MTPTEYRIGEYYVDYSGLTPEEADVAHDAAITALVAGSMPAMSIRRRPFCEFATQFFVVENKKTGAVWLFTTHDDAIKCRRKEKLDSHSLVGVSPDVYFIDDDIRNQRE